MNKLIGASIVTISVACYSLISPLLKRTSATLPPFTIMSISMFSLFSLSVIMSLIFEKNQLKMDVVKQSVPILLLVGAINLVGFWLAIQGYKYMPLWQQSLFQLLLPVFIGIVAYFVLGEQLSPKLFVGLAIMSLGLYVAVSK